MSTIAIPNHDRRALRKLVNAELTRRHDDADEYFDVVHGVETTLGRSELLRAAEDAAAALLAGRHLGLADAVSAAAAAAACSVITARLGQAKQYLELIEAKRAAMHEFGWEVTALLRRRLEQAEDLDLVYLEEVDWARVKGILAPETHDGSTAWAWRRHAKEQSGRAWRDLLRLLLPEVYESPTDLPEATAEVPGMPAKIDELRARLTAGLQLHHPSDRVLADGEAIVLDYEAVGMQPPANGKRMPSTVAGKPIPKRLVRTKGEGAARFGKDTNGLSSSENPSLTHRPPIGHPSATHRPLIARRELPMVSGPEPGPPAGQSQYCLWHANDPCLCEDGRPLCHYQEEEAAPRPKREKKPRVVRDLGPTLPFPCIEEILAYDALQSRRGCRGGQGNHEG